MRPEAAASMPCTESPCPAQPFSQPSSRTFFLTWMAASLRSNSLLIRCFSASSSWILLMLNCRPGARSLARHQAYVARSLSPIPEQKSPAPRVALPTPAAPPTSSSVDTAISLAFSSASCRMNRTICSIVLVTCRGKPHADLGQARKRAHITSQCQRWIKGSFAARRDRPRCRSSCPAPGPTRLPTQRPSALRPRSQRVASTLFCN